VYKVYKVYKVYRVYRVYRAYKAYRVYRVFKVLVLHGEAFGIQQQHILKMILYMKMVIAG